MSLASSRLAFKHRCTIERDDNAGGVDAQGYVDTHDWQTHLEDQECRAWTIAGRGADGGEHADATTTIVVEDMRMLVPVGTDVTEQDRIATVTYRGDTIIDGPVGIRTVLHHRDHLELILVEIR